MDDGSNNNSSNSGENKTKNSANPSAVSKLKNEWALFWESIAGDDVEDAATIQARVDDAFHTGKIEILNVEQLREITKALSLDRKRLYQRLESLNKELDLNAAKLETLRLVGSPEEETLRRINELNDLGQLLGNQLGKLDEKIKWTRTKQEQFLAEEMEG